MKSKIKKLNGASRQFDIEMSKETVDEAFNQALEDIRKTAKIDGFRPGKVPMDIIRKNYTDDAVDEVKRRLIPYAYQRALGEHNIRPVSYPEVSDVAIKSSGELTFKAKVDIHPEIDIKKYKGLKVDTVKVGITDEEVDEALLRLKNMFAEYTDTERPLEKGDFAICDIEAFIDGKIISKKRENAWIEIDKDASMLGMGEELCGFKKGDKKEVNVTLPENYPDAKYAGKDAVFKVDIKSTKEKDLPEFNEDFARKVGKDKMDDVREDLKTQLLEKKESDARLDMKNQIMEQLLKKSQFDPPATMVDRQLKVLIDKVENEMAQKGVDKENVEAHRDDLKKRLFPEAEGKVKLYFILDEIAGKENIETSDSEVDEWLKTLSANYNQSLEDVKQYYEKHDLLGGLKEQLREEKTLDFILSEAVISERKEK